ncbi:MAG: hypothetical protein FWH37_06350 [Candidatus Bathyarchaeota archaeon]|nr:hypothetical protein [Candidatus Termiticorpusculum sp.]
MVFKQFVLPFGIKSENRKEPFSVEAESAAVFALSVIERKSGGLMGKQEKIAYVSKVGYPLWFVVRNGFTYVFDGLNLSSYVWTYFGASQLEFKVEDFEGKFRVREEYVKFLVEFEKNFLQARNSKEVVCGGLIVDDGLLGELNRYCREAVEVYDQSVGLVLPVLKEKDVIKTLDEVEVLQLEFVEKTEMLKQLMRLVSKTTVGYFEGFGFELKAVFEEVEAKIRAQKEVINPKIEKLTRDYKKQVERLERSVGKEKLLLEKEKVRIVRAVKSVESNVERFSKQVKFHAQRGNRRSEDNFKKKLKVEKQKLDELQKRQKRVEKQVEVLVGQKLKGLSELKVVFDREVEVERQPIAVLEVFRDERQAFFDRERVRLELLTRSVLDGLGQLVGEREEFLVSMGGLGFKADFELKSDVAVVYVPFYIVAFSKVDLLDRRFFVFSPSLVYSLGFSSKVKGVLGMAKIRSLFVERFRGVSSLGERLRLEVSLGSVLGLEVVGVAQGSSLLDRKVLLRDGLFLLKEEGWFSESEFEANVLEL